MTVVSAKALEQQVVDHRLVSHHAGHLQFFGDHLRLADKAAFKAYLRPLREIDWVVYAKEPFGGLSGILCVRRFSSLTDEPITEDNGELGLGLAPFARWPFPLFGSLVQDEI